jgi:hypothetical protein
MLYVLRRVLLLTLWLAACCGAVHLVQVLLGAAP